MPIQILPPAPSTSYYTTATSASDDADDISDEDYSMDEDDEMDMDTLISRARRRGKGSVKKLRANLDEDSLSTSIITPGETVTNDPQWMRGHGTYIPPSGSSGPWGSNKNSDNTSATTTIISTLAGTLVKTNKLLSIHPLATRYAPQIGDLIVGRIHTVQTKRWLVDIHSTSLAVLLLSSINLPGGILRRRTAADELQIRGFFSEGDLLVAEVQTMLGPEGGVASLHTRSLRYGKLRNGMLVTVGGGGVVRGRRHVWTITTAAGGGDVDVVAGVNGWVWISKSTGGAGGSEKVGGNGKMGVSITRLEEESSEGIYSSVNEYISPSMRREIARLAQCIRAMVRWNVPVDEAGLNAVYEASVVEELEVVGDEMDIDGEGNKAGGASEHAGSYWVDSERAKRVVEMGMRNLGR